MKFRTRVSSPRSGSRNACTRIKNVNGIRRPSKLWNFFGAIQMIFCRDWWQWTKPGYITMTRRQSNNQWSGGIAAHPAPKISESKNPLENFSHDFLGSRRHPPSWLSSKGSNYQQGVLLIFAGVIEGHFEEKTPREFHRGGSCFYMTMLRLTGHLQHRKKLAYLDFHCLDHPPYTPYLFSGPKNQLKVWHFSSDAEVISAAETWF